MEHDLSELTSDIREIKEALLGSVKSAGLIEEFRTLRREMDDLKLAKERHEAQIRESLQFKQDAKKIVAGISIVVPFVFELVKLGLTAVWEIVKHKN